MPLATPVSEGATASDTSRGMAANEKPIPMPQITKQADTWSGVAWKRAIIAGPDAEQDHPGDQRQAGAVEAPDVAGHRPRDHDDRRGGQDPQARDRHGGAEAVVAQRGQVGRQAARQLEEAGQDDPGHVQAEAGQQRGEVGEQHRAARQHPHVHHRLEHPQLHDPPDDEEDHRADQQAQHGGRTPAPALALGDADQQRDQATRQEQGARDVRRGGRAHRRLGDEAPHHDDRRRHQDRADHEQPAPGEVVDDHAAQRDAHAPAHAEHRRDRPHGDGAAVLRELVADDREAQREGGSPHALDDAEGDQHADVGGEDRADGAEQEDPEADHHQALLAVLVAQPPHDRGADRAAEQVGGDRPGDPGGAGAELALQGRAGPG